MKEGSKMRYTSEVDARGVPEWLRIVRAVNAIIPGTFGLPDRSGPWWAGGHAEDYPTARIIFRDDDPPSVSIVAKPNMDSMDAVRDALVQAHREVTGQDLVDRFA